MTTLTEALALLDVEDDTHWTGDGLPKLDVLGSLTGSNITRAEVTSTAPDFTRKTAVALADAEEVDSDEEETDEEETATDSESAESADLTDDELVAQELKEANAALAEAKTRQAKAVAAMDVVISRNAKDSAGVTTAVDVKAFQRSQLKQREKDAGQKAALEKFLKEQQDETGTAA